MNPVLEDEEPSAGGKGKADIGVIVAEDEVVGVVFRRKVFGKFV